MSLSASWQIAFGPYVADYSRYLPRAIRGSRVFAAVGLGSILGAQIAMTFGVLAAALAGVPSSSTTRSPTSVRLGSTRHRGRFALFLHRLRQDHGEFLAQLLREASCRWQPWSAAFGASVRLPRRWARVAYIVAAVSVACGLALAGKDSFLKSFEAFILLLLAVFTPWSAINLVDYYCFTRSRYDVPALTDPNGRYGRWNMRGIVVYLIGVLVQIPFLSTGLYTGPCVAALGGADISWILGLIVPSLIYYAVARRPGRRNPAQLILPQDAAARH